MRKLFPYVLMFCGVWTIRTATILDVYIAIMVIVSLFNFKHFKKDFDLSYYFLFFFIVVVLLSGVFNDLYNISAYINNLIRILSLSLGYIFIPHWFNNEKKIHNLIKGLSITLLIIGGLAFIEFISNNIGYKFDLRLTNNAAEKGGRVYVFFSEPATLGIFTGTLLSVILYYSKETTAPKITNYAIVISFITLLISTSITAILFLIVNLIYWLWFNFRLKKRNLTMITIFIVVIGLLFLNNAFNMDFNKYYTQRSYNILNRQDNSSLQRLFGSWNYVLVNIKGRNILGIGVGQSTSFHSIGKMSEYMSTINVSVNNTLAQVLLEMGYLGLISFFLFLVSVCKKYFFFFAIIMLSSFGGIAYFYSLFWILLYFIRIFQIRENIFNIR